MFGRKKKDAYEDKLSETKFKLVYQTLREIAKETGSKEVDGKLVVDNDSLKRIISKARTTLTFVDNLDNDDE